MTSEDYNKFLAENLTSLKQKFPNVSLKSFMEFNSFLNSIIGKLIHKYMLLSYSMKVCSSISPDFAEIAASAGFPVLVEQVPGHFRNIALTTDGPYMVDLSYIQFLCKHTAYSKKEKDDVLKSYQELYDNPTKAIKIEKLPENYFVGTRQPQGQYDDLYNPVKSINEYDPAETEEIFPERFQKLREGNIDKKANKKEHEKLQNLTKARGVLFQNYDLYDTGGPSPGTGLYQHMNNYDSVEDFRKKKRKKKKQKLRKAMFKAILISANDKNIKLNDSNNLTDPTEDTTTPIPFNPAEPAGPLGLTDGIYPKEDLEDNPIGSPYYGMGEMHRVEAKQK